MGNIIFAVDTQNRLTELRESAYESEALLQALLASHPALLGMSGGAAARLLLVRREFGVPDASGGNARWSLDHLFIDQQGVPVLVEVKRATDSRARREVVAQMLDYAANGVSYWPIEQLIDSFEQTCTAAGETPDETLAAFTGTTDPEPFWRSVESNLRSGRIRMVFVADQIAHELRRIVEFLNEQMRPAEVLAIEVRNFVGADGARTLVPQLVGATERARAAKTVGAAAPMDEPEFLDALASAHGAEAAAMAGQVLDALRARGFSVAVSNSTDSMAASAALASGKRAWPFFVRRSSGKVETSLQYLRAAAAFADDETRDALLAKLKAVPGGGITTAKNTGWPAIPLAAFASAETASAFWQIVDEVQERLAASS